MENPKTYDELLEQVGVLIRENERLREERNQQADELIKHVKKFEEFRAQYQKLQDEIDFVYSIVTKQK